MLESLGDLAWLLWMEVLNWLFLFNGLRRLNSSTDRLNHYQFLGLQNVEPGPYGTSF